MAKALEFTSLDFFNEKDVQIAMSFSSMDFRDIGKRKGSFSRTIKMPSTKVNDTFFGSSFEANAEGFFDPLIKVPIKIEEIEFFGTIQLKSIEILNGRTQHYSVNIFGDLANWATLIGEGTLRGLDNLGSHTLSRDTIKASWGNDGLSADGYVYPLISYGNFLQDRATTENVVISQIRPAFFVLPLIRQIFKEAGYTFIDTGIVDSKWKNAILPYTSKEVQVTEDLLLVDVQTTFTQSFTTPSIFLMAVDFTNNNINNPRSAEAAIRFYEEVSDKADLYKTVTSRYTCSVTDQYRLVINTEMSFSLEGGNSSGGRFSLGMRVTKASGGVFSTMLSGPYEMPINTGEPQAALSVNTTIQLSIGDILQPIVIIELDPASDILGVLVKPTVLRSLDLYQGTMTIEPVNATLSVGAEIDHSLNIQNIKKIDLIKEIIGLGFFRIITNEQAKTVEFVQESKFLLTTPEDWSDKQDASRNVTISLQGGAKELEWNFTNDADDNFIKDSADRNDTEWGRKRVQLDSEYRKGNQVIHSSIFSTTIDWTGISLLMPVMSTQEIPEDALIAASTFETNFANRILIYGGLQSGDWTLDSEFQTQYPYSYFVNNDFSLQFDNIQDLKKVSTFVQVAGDIGLVDRYYTGAIARLNKSKIYTGYFKLNETDIATLDFRSPKLIDGIQYYLNKVTDYKLNSNQSTKVELISR